MKKFIGYALISVLVLVVITICLKAILSSVRQVQQGGGSSQQLPNYSPFGGGMSPFGGGGMSPFGFPMLPGLPGLPKFKLF